MDKQMMLNLNDIKSKVEKSYNLSGVWCYNVDKNETVYVYKISIENVIATVYSLKDYNMSEVKQYKIYQSEKGRYFNYKSRKIYIKELIRQN